LAKYEAELADYLHRVVLLSPCTVGLNEAMTLKLNNDIPAMDALNGGNLRGELARVGVYDIDVDSETWEADKSRICGVLSDDICKWATDRAWYSKPIPQMLDHNA